jgi:hypothetical protein
VTRTLLLGSPLSPSLSPDLSLPDLSPSLSAPRSFSLSPSPSVDPSSCPRPCSCPLTSVVYAEGNTYNILSQEITHLDHFQTVQNQTHNRSLNKFKAREVFQQTLNQNTEQADSLKEEQKVNRISFQRWDQTIDRGYDPITNNKLPPSSLLPLSKRPMTVWEKLQIPSKEGHQTRPGTQQPQHQRYDLSQNHGSPLDWGDGMRRDVSSSPALKEVQSSSRLGMAMNKSSVSLALASASPAVDHTSRTVVTVPSLDLTRTSSSSAVRTGGLA